MLNMSMIHAKESKGPVKIEKDNRMERGQEHLQTWRECMVNNM